MIQTWKQWGGKIISELFLFVNSVEKKKKKEDHEEYSALLSHFKIQGTNKCGSSV